MAAFKTWHWQWASSPEASSNLLCGSVFPVIISPSLSVFFVLAGPVWSAQTNWLGVSVGRSPYHYLEVANYLDCYFNFEKMLSLRDQDLLTGSSSHCCRIGLHSILFYVISQPFSCLVMRLQQISSLNSTVQSISVHSVGLYNKSLTNWLPELIKAISRYKKHV